MRHAVTVKQMEHEIRRRICPHCYHRPPGQGLSPTEPRPCEARCPIFLNLAELKEIAEHLDPMIGSYERAVKERICPQCKMSPAPGDYCPEHMARTCPLSRYSREVVQILEELA